MTRAQPMAQTIGATTIVVADAGIAIRGVSGAGKSSLAIALIEACRGRCFARLVADDVTRVECRGGRVIARSVPHVAGLIERRGLGIVPMQSTDAVILRLIVDCIGHEPPRLPEPDMLVASILGVTLPRVAVAGLPRDASLIFSTLELMYSGRGLDAE